MTKKSQIDFQKIPAKMLVMSNQIDLQPIRQALTSSQEVLICLKQNPEFDEVAAGLGIYLSLKKAGKKPTVVCPTPMIVEFSHLVGLDKIKPNIGSKNLVVSFDYVQDSIEKVSYNVENNKFNLVIQPKKGTKPLDAKSVTFTYSGLSADMIFTIGAKSFEDVGEIYAKNKEVFTNAYSISLNRYSIAPFAQTTITDENTSSLSQLVAWFLEQIGYMATDDSATNLLSGIDYETNYFSAENTQASTFMVAGSLMQNGAVRKPKPQERPKVPNVPLPLIRPMSIEDSQNMAPVDVANPPKEWLEPKILQGSSRV